MSSVVSIRVQDDADDELMAVAENVSPLIEYELVEAVCRSLTNTYGLRNTTSADQ